MLLGDIVQFSDRWEKNFKFYVLRRKVPVEVLREMAVVFWGLIFCFLGGFLLLY